ncbi:hypothetical protein [Chryseobacterium gallinarum]|uniref:Uncharacterized protein n=1 Tax=Chryseobacterium gallinarum TaxID=1324352 RepID=A0ABX6KNL1_CHRGL|nr:hypothetical protein [Chryseobacterium gallinarum]QIY89636.1 hypothetical protein FOB44_02735 [Chryseobacterium gallinarum]
MNYVTIVYLINLFLYSFYFFGRIGSEGDTSGLDVGVSGVLSLFLMGAGYLNAKKGMAYRSVLWMFFINLLLFAMAGVFDQFGKDFNILSTGGSDSFLFTLALIAYNGYLFPLTVLLDGSGLAIIIPVMLSFILPSLGYLIGIKRYSAKEDADKVTNEVKK